MTFELYPLPRGSYTAEFISADFYKGTRKNKSTKAIRKYSEESAFNYTLRVFYYDGQTAGMIAGGFPVKLPLSANSPITKFINSIDVDLEDLPGGLIGKKVTAITNLAIDPNLGLKAHVVEFHPYAGNM